MLLKNRQQKVLVENRWLTLFEDCYTLPNGADCIYYHVHQGDTVMAMVVDGDQGAESTYIVNQFRLPIDRNIWQFPLGGFDPSQSTPEAMARVELAEECGLEVGDIKCVGSFFANPGFSNKKHYVCISSEVLSQQNPDLEETEYGLISRRVPIREIPVMIESGEMGDAWGITGYFYLQRFLNANN